jgi:signal transduction histidine kinase
LVFVLAFLSFAALFIRSIANIKIVLLVNLVATIVVGHFLVKSVKIVERQRQLLEKANQNQESLFDIIKQKVNGYMTKSRNIFDGLLAGDYGPLQDEKMKEIVKYGFDSETKGVETVQSILRASDLKTGRTEFKKERTNLSKLVAELSERAKEAALKKGLDFTFEIEPNIEAMVDPLRIGEVFKNLMDNAVIYTIKGQVHVILKRDADSQIKFAVIDTGFGLTAEDKAKLFTEGGKGTDSIDVNIDSTGYGLFIAKKIVDQHDGKIGAHSDGRDKGSEFFVILPKMQ